MPVIVKSLVFCAEGQGSLDHWQRTGDLMFAPFLGVLKVPGTGSGIPKIVPDMDLLFQALLRNPRLRICVCVEGRNRSEEFWNS